MVVYINLASFVCVQLLLLSVSQRILEHCSNGSDGLIDEILQSACILAQDQYGNYVTQVNFLCSLYCNIVYTDVWTENNSMEDMV